MLYVRSSYSQYIFALAIISLGTHFPHVIQSFRSLQTMHQGALYDFSIPTPPSVLACVVVLPRYIGNLVDLEGTCTSSPPVPSRPVTSRLVLPSPSAFPLLSCQEGRTALHLV